ncbi:MAG: DUF4869 domain-containing protein [Lachnospiraceae bacterium]|nr:DUF4869 domain-containing protein [Lachnospiraceae bacterium]
MLKIYFGEMENVKVLHNVETYFDNQYQYSWLEDPFVVDLIKTVDRSIVESPECIKSPVLRQIPPTRLSGGTKAVILMKYCPERVVNASNCGNNCAEWILKLGTERDLIINLHHIMEFPKERFEIEVLNGHTIVHDMKEMVESAIDYL